MKRLHVFLFGDCLIEVLCAFCICISISFFDLGKCFYYYLGNGLVSPIYLVFFFLFYAYKKTWSFDHILHLLSIPIMYF